MVKTQTVSGTGEVTISEVHLLDEQGNVTEFVSVGHRVSLQVNVEVKDDIPELVVGYMIKDRLGQPIFGTNTYHLNQTLTSLKKEKSVRSYFLSMRDWGWLLFCRCRVAYFQYAPRQKL